MFVNFNYVFQINLFGKKIMFGKIFCLEKSECLQKKYMFGKCFYVCKKAYYIFKAEIPLNF